MTTPQKSGPKGAGQAAALPAESGVRLDPAFELDCLAIKVHSLAFTMYGGGAESFQAMDESHRRSLTTVLRKLALRMPALADEVAARPSTGASNGTALRTAVDELVALTANISGGRFDDFVNCADVIQDSVLWLVADAASTVIEAMNEGGV